MSALTSEYAAPLLAGAGTTLAVAITDLSPVRFTLRFTGDPYNSGSHTISETLEIT